MGLNDTLEQLEAAREECIRLERENADLRVKLEAAEVARAPRADIREEARADRETCRVCEADRTGDRSVTHDESIPLCQWHWNLWLMRYIGPDAPEPPCSAHLIGVAALGGEQS